MFQNVKYVLKNNEIPSSTSKKDMESLLVLCNKNNHFYKSVAMGSIL